MTLTVDVRVDDRDVEAAFHVADEVVAIVGENGAGKSTLLATMAGSLRPDRGTIRVGERVLTGSGRQTPTYRRRVGLLAQQPLLFPHLTVLENVAFGPRSAGKSRAEARTAAEAWLERVGATALATAPATDLSGGQAQRVALARALAAEPDIVLLDEPFAALDVDAADDLRAVVRRAVAGRPTILVSHDVVDVVTIADRVIVLDRGRVIETGSVAEIVNRPRSAFAARLVGRELIRGVREGSGLRLPSGRWLAGTVATGAPEGAAVAASYHPAAVFLEPGVHEGTVSGSISEARARGMSLLVRVEDLRAEVALTRRDDLGPGVAVTLRLNPADLLIYPEGPAQVHAARES